MTGDRIYSCYNELSGNRHGARESRAYRLVLSLHIAQSYP